EGKGDRTAVDEVPRAWLTAKVPSILQNHPYESLPLEGKGDRTAVDEVSRAGQPPKPPSKL
ncbi:MAG: hypothetical protein IJY24_05035, partial [Clostridia bacterium]|nr:hypothetical protein [Clostridia bacterium]